MTPRERAELIVRVLRTGQQTYSWLCTQIESAITSAISDQTAALQAALEELARVKRERDQALKSANIQCEIRYSELARAEKAERERDGLAAALLARERPIYADEDQARVMDTQDKGASIALAWLASHDRQVAARVLREAAKLLAAHDHKERLQPRMPNTDPRAWAATCYECAAEDFSIMAAEYEAGTREVPGE